MTMYVLRPAELRNGSASIRYSTLNVASLLHNFSTRLPSCLSERRLNGHHCSTCMTCVQKSAGPQEMLSPQPLPPLLPHTKKATVAPAFDIKEHSKTISLPRPHQGGEVLNFSVVGELKGADSRLLYACTSC